MADFLHGSRLLEPLYACPAERYQWIELTLRHFCYARLSKADNGLVVAYLGRITGYSRQQLTRLIRRYRDQGHVRWQVSPVNGFTARYNDADVAMLAQIDALHDTPSGPAAKKLCERAWTRFGDARYQHLAGISVSHLYNLRHAQSYRKHRRVQNKTRAVKRAVGARRKPEPTGRPGFIRIDTVHQGDQDGRKGRYHINAVDEVTQFELVTTVERISE